MVIQMNRSFDVITFDCYGTLIDWEAGIGDAFRTAAAGAGLDLGRDEIMRVYHEVEPTVQASTYLRYREILREVAFRVAQRFDWELEPADTEFLPNSLVSWPPFRDTDRALQDLLERGYELGILSNIDDDLLAGTLRHFSVGFDVLVTAQQVESYKPQHAHFIRARELIGSRRWLHAAQSYFHDVEPAAQLDIPVFWVNRKHEDPTGNARPLAQAETLRGLVEWLDGAN
jgi:2-haloalkanoic acid dehalogenase type II